MYQAGELRVAKNNDVIVQYERLKKNPLHSMGSFDVYSVVTCMYIDCSN